MKNLFALIMLSLVVSSCEKTGFTLNPKQVHVQVLAGYDYSINVVGNNYDITLTEDSPVNGFNVKRGQHISVRCIRGDSVLVAVAGDVVGDYRDGTYMSEGDEINIRVN